MYLPMCSCQLIVGLKQPLASVGEALLKERLVLVVLVKAAITYEHWGSSGVGFGPWARKDENVLRRRHLPQCCVRVLTSVQALQRAGSPSVESQ